MPSASTRPGDAVLVVDDESALLEVLADSIRDSGRFVLTARDGSEALETLASMPRPCLVLLDIQMVGMDGYRFLDELDALPDAGGVYVLLMTADSHPAPPVASSRVVGQLQKPFELEELLSLLESVGDLPT